MTKLRRAIWGVIAIMALAVAVERLASLSRPEPSVSMGSTEARRAIIKQRAESARERLRERQEKRAEREALERDGTPVPARPQTASAPAVPPARSVTPTAARPATKAP
ncbi:MAG: hypothetical protein WBJ03_08220, partial [Moraxellaceae bacterium]